jgi:hypothetical protein
MRYLKPYNESVDYDDIINLVKISLEDNPDFEVSRIMATRYFKLRQHMELDSDGNMWIFHIECDVSKNERIMDTFAKADNNYTRLPTHKKRALREIVGDILNTALTKVARKYDLELSDLELCGWPDPNPIYDDQPGYTAAIKFGTDTLYIRYKFILKKQ